MRRTSVLLLLCTLLCCPALVGQTVHKLKVTLKGGETVEYPTDEIEKVVVDDTPVSESGLIKVEEIGKTSFSFSINAGGQKYIFAAFETGYIEQYGEEYMLAMFGHVATEDATYEWVDGDFFEFEDITVQPGHNYTILAAAPYVEQQAPDRIERVDITTVAEEQSKSTVSVTFTELTAGSVKVTATPDAGVSSYIVYVRDKAWVDGILSGYGEAVLQDVVETAAQQGLADLYASKSEKVWDGLASGTDYNCIVVIEDNEGKKKMDIYGFTTLE